MFPPIEKDIETNKDSIERTAAAKSDNEAISATTVEPVAVISSSTSNNHTVPPEVNFKDRKYTDPVFGIIYAISYIAYLSTGFTLVAKARPRYEWSDNTLILTDDHRSDLIQCCARKISSSASQSSSFDLCYEFDINNGRRILMAGNSKFHGDEGIFDAFVQAPEIIVGTLSLVVFLAVTWIVLLRFFAKPIVILTQLVKIGIFIYMGIEPRHTTGTRVVCFLMAAGLILWDIWARKEILFAAKVIRHSTIAMKENPKMFIGAIIFKLFYVLNAYFFVLFFSNSFNNVYIELTTERSNNKINQQCEFVAPSYVNSIMIYTGLSYLWTNLLFDKMRLSMIATIVGSWHFHPDNQPGIIVAIKNSLTTSFGTLTVASLISTIAEKANRMMMEPCWKTWLSPVICCTFPLHLLLCCLGACLNQLIRMLTSFAIILHVFTGGSFMDSAKQVFKIMSRHFKGGYITDLTSRSVLKLGSYIFSMGVFFTTWTWFDDRFDSNTLVNNEKTWQLILWIFFGLFNLWYPVLGIYLIILVNMILQQLERGHHFSSDDKKENYQHYWLPPLASIFVGCISMMFFTFVSKIILDVIDTLFLCFAIDKDNDIDTTRQEIHALVEAVPIYGGVISPNNNEANNNTIPVTESPVVYAEVTPVVPAYPSAPPEVETKV